MSVRQRLISNTQHHRIRPKAAGKALFVVIGLLPAVIHLLVFCAYPVLATVFISLHESCLLGGSKPFVGLANFAAVLTDDLFWISLRNTLCYVLIYVALFAGLGLSLALAVQQQRGFMQSFVKTVIFLPVIAPTVAVAVTWKWMYQPAYGVLNYLLSRIGLGPFGWTASPSEALVSVIIFSVWKGLGYSTVIFLAGLLSIPREYHEAAQVDGASGFESFLHVTLPLLLPTVLFILVVATISAFQVFSQVYVLTGGGPATSTLMIVQYIYETAFKFLDMGKATAMALLLFLVILGFSQMQRRFLRGGYEGY